MSKPTKRSAASIRARLLKYVQDQLGHKTPYMTLSVYAHVTAEARKEAQERFQAYLTHK